MQTVENNVQTFVLEDGLCRVRDAAAFLAVSRGKVYQMMERGDLPFVRIGRARRIPKSALIAFRERNLVGTID